MPDWKLWREMSQETLTSARELEAISQRNAISRYYYAAYQMTTAFLLYRGLQPPLDREAWSHAETPDMLKEYLKPLLKSADKRKDLATRLQLLYKTRCAADYASLFRITDKVVEQIKRDAGHIIKTIEKFFPGD